MIDTIVLVGDENTSFPLQKCEASSSKELP